MYIKTEAKPDLTQNLYTDVYSLSLIKMSSELYTIRFSKFERKKYNDFLKNSSFKTFAELIREALNIYISDPESRNPTKEKTNLDEALKGFDLFLSRKEKEETELINLVRENRTQIEIIGNLVNLLAEEAGISKRDLKKAKKKDTSMEDIFND